MPPRKKVADTIKEDAVATKTRKASIQKSAVTEEPQTSRQRAEEDKKETIVYHNSKIFPGKKVLYNDMRFVVLDTTNDGVLVISDDIIGKMRFSDNSDKGSNDWRKSIIRKKLNSDYIQKFDANDLLTIVSDLTADTGEDNYGICEDLIAIPSDAAFRKFNKLIPAYNTWVWSLTPWAIDYSSMSAVSARTQNKTIYSEQANRELGVVILCILKQDVVEKMI